ncbi:hypothetical protein CSUB01_11988 [Colletotrichum sublineola]|uniref:Uncharacterized protein n=1 Tax=Colletotrichum sublineola TaxID=1173701 RepID=A0A066XIU7_COLSU|nr:hypothetical protein CSUB01_11988 [Colletotrichum sublineola]
MSLATFWTEVKLAELTTMLKTEVGPLALGFLAARLGLEGDLAGFDVASTIIHLRQCATKTAETRGKGINGVPWFLRRPISNPLGDGVTAVFPGDTEMCLVVYKVVSNRLVATTRHIGPDDVFTLG